MSKLTIHELVLDPSKDIDEQITAAFEAIVAKHQAECPECSAEAEAEAKVTKEEAKIIRKTKAAGDKDAAEANLGDTRKTSKHPGLSMPFGGRQPIGYAAFLHGKVIEGSMRIEKADVEEIIQERLETEAGRLMGALFGIPKVKPVFGE